MSEPGTSGTSEGVSAGPALAGRARRPPAQHSNYWLISRLLATAGAVLVAVAAWLPWVAVSVFDITGGKPLSTRFQLDPGDLATDQYGGLFWGTLTVAGMLIVPFLWRRSRPGWHALIAPLVYAVWVVALLVLGGMAAYAIRWPGGPLTLVPELRPSPITVGVQQLLLGVWVGGAGALVALVAAVALVGSLARPPLATQPPAATARNLGGRRPAIGALIFGVLLFWLGTLILPWATVNCTAMPLFFGQCTGLPFSGVLADAIRVDIAGLDPLAAIYSANVLLSGGALLVLIAVFSGARSRFFAFWTTVWLLVATGFVALASVGVRLAASQPAQLGLPSGSWSGDMGIFVTLLALGLGWIGAGALWLSRQRSASA